jgi:hypothetical protein
MEASVVSWQAELFQHGQRPNLTTWVRFQGRPFRFGSSRAAVLFQQMSYNPCLSASIKKAA